MLFNYHEIEEADEVYLILGNGFDLEAGLPTRYTQFLSFLKVALKLIVK